MDKNTKGKLAFLCAIGVLLLIIFNRWLFYWIYYMPFYTIFENSLYLSFYLYVAALLISCTLILFLAIVLIRKKTKKNIACGILFVILSIVLLYFNGKDAFNDIVFIAKEKYLTVECNINSLKKVQTGNKGRRIYEINSIEKIERKYVYIEMNFYQYTELLKEQNTNENKILLVYYLPNTKIMLKYEERKRQKCAAANEFLCL